MKIVKIKSGLGNQMFQYAFAKAYGKQTGETVFLDLSQYNLEFLHNGFELDRVFNIDMPQASSEIVQMLATVPDSFSKRLRRKFLTKQTHFIEDESLFNDEVFTLQGNYYFEGYWQSEKYFQAIKDEIPNIFAFSLPLSQKSTEFLSFIDESTASLHVRRGDYLQEMNRNLNICTQKYYDEAVGLLRHYFPIEKIAVFSDDVPWCKQHFAYKNIEMRFVDWNSGNDAWQDMYLMSQCAHNVIANSSFSWWGAYLNKNPNKMIIAPDKWNKKQKHNLLILPAGWKNINV